MKSLPMAIEDKQDFANIVLENNQEGSSQTPAIIGFILEMPALGDSNYISVCYDNHTLSDNVTFVDVTEGWAPYNNGFSINDDGYVYYEGYAVYHNMDGNASWNAEFSNPVKGIDKLESKIYYVDRPIGI